jgi:hypothetical protein
MLNKKFLRLPQVALYLLYGVIALLTISAYVKYPGQAYIYLLFTVVSNVLLYLGFRKKALFFDAFISVFFWLGFWLKLTIRVGFTGALFHEPTGSFDSSSAAFDHGLLVTSCGLLGLISSMLIRERFFYYPDNVNHKITQPGLFNFYQKNRKSTLMLFAIVFLSIAVTNLYFGIYQRGEVPQTILPYGLGGVYKWLLLFGLASFAAIVLKFEYVNEQKNSYLVALLSLMESFISNVSLLSRGMILNSTGLFYGLFRNAKSSSIKLSFRFLVTISLIFSLLFVSSVFLVNYLRSSIYSSEDRLKVTQHMATPLFLDRWVGIEGVLAVSSSQKVGWDLWNQAWGETYSDHSTSFYDLNLIKSPYLDADTTKHHYISLPGIIAFCFYPGSFSFLFWCVFLVGTLGGLIEFIVYKLGGANLILCSLLGQVVAFRFASFGYVPSQTYLLFGSLLLNLIIIYAADKLLLAWNRRPTHSPQGQ